MLVILGHPGSPLLLFGLRSVGLLPAGVLAGMWHVTE